MPYLGKDICWKSCSMELTCLHAGRFCEHPLSVFEAILKYSKRLFPSFTEWYFLPERPLPPLKNGRKYYLRLVFPSASVEEVKSVQNAVRQWLADPRNHFSVTFGEIAYESVESAVASLSSSEEEFCLELLSPLNLPEKMQILDGGTLIALLLARVEKLFGPLSHGKALLEASNRLHIIPYTWEYKEYRHASKSSGGTQYLNGFQGKFLLRGELHPLIPLIAVCTRTGCGPRLGCGLGAFRSGRTDLLRQEWTSLPALLSSRDFLTSHGYELNETCVEELKQTVENNGGTLSESSLLLAQEIFLRLLRKPVHFAFPFMDDQSSLEFSWQSLRQSSQPGESGLASLSDLLSISDRKFLPLIREIWKLEGVPQMLDLQIRMRAGTAVREAASLGLKAGLTREGITLGNADDREGMLDLLAQQGIVITSATQTKETNEEGERLTPWRRNLHILHPGAAIGLDGDAVIARFDGETLLRTPLGQISALLLHGAGSVSTPLMRRCMTENIPIVLCESGGRLTGSLVPQTPAWRKRSRDHARHWELLGEKGRFFMAREFITAKIENFLCRTPRGMQNRREFQAAGRKALDAVNSTRTPQELLGVEGSFARMTFRAYNDCVVNEVFHSDLRQPRSRQDLWNTALDTASFFTFQRIAMELIAEGLDPFLGIFHRQNLRYMTLAADIQELFRADVERWLLCMVNQNILREEHFMQENGRFNLTREGRRLFLTEWEAGLQTKFSIQPDSPARSLSRQIRSLRLWLCSGLPPELYTGSGWRMCNRVIFSFS